MKKVSVSFVTGAIALVFLVVGYQAALLVHHSSLALIAAHRDAPDTVWVEGGSPDIVYGERDEPDMVYGEGDASVQELGQRRNPGGSGSSRGSGSAAGGGKAGVAGAGQGGVSSSSHSASGRAGGARGDFKAGAGQGGSRTGGSAGGGTSNGNGKVGGKALTRRSGAGTAYGENLREKLPRRVENFRFDPNTASLEDLERLGFSVKQAQSIVNYREKGGRFRRKEDFRKSYVVADSVYERLEAYIDIPLLDINKADSAQFDALPGIGGYFARKMVQQRKALGGYSHTAQLLDIHKFDKERYDALSALICCSQPKPYELWTLPADSLRLHPYIRSYAAARSIVFFREHNPREKWSVQALFDAGILSDEQAEKLSRCNIAAP